MAPEMQAATAPSPRLAAARSTGNRRRHPIWTVLAAGGALLALVLAGCGDDKGSDDAPVAEGEAVPSGRFEDLPVHPRSEPAGKVSEKDGVTTRSYIVEGETPETVMDFYVDTLPARGWVQVGEVEESGRSTLQGDWTQEGWNLRVSANDAQALGGDRDPTESVTSQYSLVLSPG